MAFAFLGAEDGRADEKAPGSRAAATVEEDRTDRVIRVRTSRTKKEPVVKKPSKRKSVRVALHGTGTRDGGRKEPVQDEPVQDEPRPYYEHPIHGWMLFHDGEFDPLTESAYEMLGAERVYNIGQGDDLQSFKSGRVDIDGVLEKLRRRYPGGIDGYVTLDWEDPFFEILHGGPGHEGYEETRDHILEFIIRFKAAFPGAKVTHYNLPTLPYWRRNSDGRMVRWNGLDAAEQAKVYEELEAMRVLLDEMDWFSPRFYDFIPTELFPVERRKDMRRDELEYRKDMAAWLRTYVDKSQRPDRPIIPIVRTNWVGGAGGYEKWVDHPVPVDEFIDEQVMPALTGGADGVMIWEGWDMWMQHLSSIDPATISPELREQALRYYRILGIIDENEVPDWRSASAMRERLKALGHRQMRYVAATASVMRQLAPPSRDEAREENPGEGRRRGEDRDGRDERDDRDDRGDANTGSVRLGVGRGAASAGETRGWVKRAGRKTPVPGE